jgi:hypothetical protein
LIFILQEINQKNHVSIRTSRISLSVNINTSTGIYTVAFSDTKEKGVEAFWHTRAGGTSNAGRFQIPAGGQILLALLALMALIFTLAAPQFGTRLQTVQRQGIELIIALDVSNSMNAQDIEPSRLESAPNRPLPG